MIPRSCRGIGISIPIPFLLDFCENSHMSPHIDSHMDPHMGFHRGIIPIPNGLRKLGIAKPMPNLVFMARATFLQEGALIPTRVRSAQNWDV